MKSTVFQYVLFFNPTSKDLLDEMGPRIIEHGFVAAADPERAKLIAARKLSADWDSLINDIEVLVRPF